MAKTTHRPRTHSARVSYAEAHRLRTMLLSADVDTLSRRDVHTMIKILNDIYPVRQTHSSAFMWQPLLVGVGIGLFLVICFALLL
jgi:hypothetical protein